jgi:hypothetical protein
MIYFMVKQLDTIVLLDEDKVNHLPRNRHNILFTATLHKMKEKKEYDWLDDPFVHTLYKKNKPQREHATPQRLFLTMPPQIIHSHLLVMAQPITGRKNDDHSDWGIKQHHFHHQTWGIKTAFKQHNP